ncbi:MAG: hypothetical protein COV67_13850 [Nitrospinae bacterium CG11_big_fil_rev_8_21_14_0_20_56_8]|nr:MAG: hypothetical protein COV67_13850 [Nitrospinae bacterium CG11_big_fil_rev_8_21_14_0_20_56_8]
MTELASGTCKVCRSPSPVFYSGERIFFKCPNCHLVFTEHYPGKDAEERHYKSQWQTPNPGFWKSQADVLLDIVHRYRVPENILDFGSGTGELAGEISGRGYRVTCLEPMIHGFLKDQKYPFRFDVVVALEVFEHLHRLWEELIEIDKCLVRNGVIFCSTALTDPFIDREDAAACFAQWWYKDDPTHVNFFCTQSLEHVARKLDYDLAVYDSKAFVMLKGRMGEAG